MIRIYIHQNIIYFWFGGRKNDFFVVIRKILLIYILEKKQFLWIINHFYFLIINVSNLGQIAENSS